MARARANTDSGATFGPRGGGSYTVRVDEHRSESIVLLRPCPDPDGYEPIELRAQDGDVRVEAELVEVLQR